MALPEAFKKNAEKKKEEGEVREGEKDTEEKKPPFMKKGKTKKKKETKDTEIIPGGEGSEGVTKMNDPRKKGAPSLDDENTDACAKKDAKKGKDCGCSHKNDSLTPQEYIAACDLGIQDRNRIYIRARLDAGAGTGKKCGASHIPRAATCNKNGGGGSKSGSASKTKKTKTTFVNQLRQGMAIAGAVNNGLSAVNSISKGQYGSALVQANYAIGNARAANSYSQNNARKAGRQTLGHYALGAGLSVGLTAGNMAARTPGARNAARSAGAAAGRAYGNTVGRAAGASKRTAFNMEQRAAGFRKMKRPNMKGSALAKRDSPWANGFSKTDAETALTGNAMNLATDKYKGEKRKKNAQGQPRNTIIANTFNT